MAETVCLVTGANRGIGFGLTQTLLQRPNTTVVAGVRDLSKATSLSALQPAKGSKLIVVKLDSQSHSDPAAAVEQLQSKHAISKIDIVIANAGIAEGPDSVATVSLDRIRNHFETNTLGPLSLLQATLPLLQKSSTPKFVGISSVIGSMASMGDIPIPATAYGISKAAFDYWLLKAHYENPWLIIFPMQPGWVQTDMGNEGARQMGQEKAPVTVEDSVNGILKKTDTATREEASGVFWDFEGKKIGW